VARVLEAGKADAVTEPNIILDLGQTAEPGECGSCRYFGRRSVEAYLDRDPYNRGGYCKFNLPPHIQRRDQGEGAPTNWINDSGKCDLWTSSGKTFVVSRKVTP
jgi:hypothetical protein